MILADEPTGNLDTVSTEDIMRVFDRLNEMGRTVVLITHEPEVAGHAKRLISLRDGRIVSDERRDEPDEPPPVLTSHVPVVVIGPTVVTNLFAGQNPIGQTIQVNGSNFQVVGVTQPKGSNGAQDQDDIAFAPITAVQDVLTGYGSISSITVQDVPERTDRSTERGHIDPRAATRDHGEQPRVQCHQPGHDPVRLAIDQRRVHDAARRGRRDLATCRRDRRDEHHARLGQRAHARDRNPQGAGAGIAYISWHSDNDQRGYAQYLRAFSTKHGWISAPTQLSSAFGNRAVRPGDTFGISSWPPDHLVVSWGSATPPASKKSEIFAATITVSLP